MRIDEEARDPIQGGLKSGGMIGALVPQCLVTCLMSAVSIVGWFCLAMWINPKNLGENPVVFGLLGSTLLTLCAAGFYFAVARYWLGSVHSFHWNGETLQYRTILSRTLHERFADEIEEASARRPNSRAEEAGTWRSIRFRDGTRLKLHVGMLQNANELFAALKSSVEQCRSEVTPSVLPPISPESPLWELIQPHLDEGERVLWMGRPVYRKLWSEMSAEMVFGLIPGSMGLALLILSLQIEGKDGGSAFMAIIGLFFSGIGLYLLAAPWRYRRMLRNTLYAVTSQRAIILNGVTWGSQSTVDARGVEVDSYDREQSGLFEVVGRRRDIILGGEWRRGRKGRRFWVSTGFLAADDPLAAENAIRFLIAENSQPALQRGR